jgi:hypothetical protein
MLSRRLPIGFAIIGAVTLVGISIGVPAAQAATVTFANGRTVNSNDVVTSGSRASVAGGTAEISVGVGSVLTSTYYDYPGFRVVSENIVPAGSIASTSHPAQANAISKCIWWVSVGGYADITCTVRG